MNFNFTYGWILASLLIAILLDDTARAQDEFSVQLTNCWSHATALCSEDRSTCGGFNSYRMAFQVPEVRYGANLGFPQFGHVTHGVWYNGPKSGLGQNRSTKTRMCSCKSCKTRRAKTSKKCECSQCNRTDNLTEIFAQGGWQIQELTGQTRKSATTSSGKSPSQSKRSNSIAVKPLPEPKSIRIPGRRVVR